MYKHKTCGSQIHVRSLVYEYAPLDSFSAKDGRFTGLAAGDVEDSVVEHSELWCENCACTITSPDDLSR